MQNRKVADKLSVVVHTYNLERPKLEDSHKLKASLNYRVRPCLRRV